MIGRAQLSIDDLLGQLSRQFIEQLLVLSAQTVAGAKHPGIHGTRYSSCCYRNVNLADLGVITYPDEFLLYSGFDDVDGGLIADNQPSRLFNLSYRTNIGNDLDGPDHGYKIHIHYGLLAIPTDVAHSTETNVAVPQTFQWNLSGSLQEVYPGYRPFGHIILDSRFTESSLLESIETLLYGDTNEDSALPSIQDLAMLIMDPEVEYLTTEDGDTLTTEDGQLLIAGIMY